MSRPYVFTWNVPDTNYIANATTSTGAGSFVLNTYGFGFPIISQAQRTVQLTSTFDNTTVNFTITGLDNFNIPVTETLAGPNFGVPVETTVQFHTITSVSFDDAIQNVSVGTGTAGTLQWCKLNYHNDYFQTSIQADVTGTVSFNMFRTSSFIEIPTINGMIINPNIPTFLLTSAGTATGQAVTIPNVTFPANADFNVTLTQPTTGILTTFTGGVGNTGSAIITILQQGIR